MEMFPVAECPVNFMRCPSGQCITEAWVCDDFDDCGDGADEIDCGTLFSFVFTEYSCSAYVMLCIPRPTELTQFFVRTSSVCFQYALTAIRLGATVQPLCADVSTPGMSVTEEMTVETGVTKETAVRTCENCSISCTLEYRYSHLHPLQSAAYQI